MAEITPGALKSNKSPTVKSPTNTLSLENISLLHKSSLFSKGKQAALVEDILEHSSPLFTYFLSQLASITQGTLTEVANGLYPEVSQERQKNP